MSAERERWEARHGRASDRPEIPSALLRRSLHRLPRGRALEVACGSGRNARFLAAHGFRVDAIDLSRAALVRTRGEAGDGSICVVQADLLQFPLPRRRYQIAVNVRYLQRNLWPALKHALADGGMIVFETFLRDQRQIGHPRNPDYLLERGELANAFSDFAIEEYEEGCFESEGGPAFLARMLARRPQGWEAD
jgi:SAM-dependent methyltransferase